MARTFRQIIKDPKRTGAELGLVLMEKLRNQIQGDDLVATDKEIASMSKELIPEELAIFSMYEAIFSTVLNIYNFSRQTTFKFYASYNALVTYLDKARILECMHGETLVPERLRNLIERKCSTFEELRDQSAEIYETMFEAVTFIEASNAYTKNLLAHFSIGGLSCMQYDTDVFYTLMDKLGEQTRSMIKCLNPGRVGEAEKAFMNLENTVKKEFLPDAKKVSEFKEFLRKEPNRVIKNSFSFIMLLQNHKQFKGEL